MLSANENAGIVDTNVKVSLRPVGSLLDNIAFDIDEFRRLHNNEYGLVTLDACASHTNNCVIIIVM